MKPEVEYTFPDGTVERMDIPTVQARHLHTFKNWYCTIGQKTLYIATDGRVWRGSCLEGQPLGTVDSDWEKPAQGLVCTRKWCKCGGDIKQEKFSLTTPRAHVRPIPEDEHIVIWDIGRYCNFDCSYCPAHVHNLTDPHRGLPELITTANKVLDYFDGETGINVCFAGGEPTMNPAFVDLCGFLHAMGQNVHVQTNGSRGRRYWEELVPYTTSITISVHFEFMNLKMLLRNVRTILREGGNLEVKLMALDMDKVEEFKTALAEFGDAIKVAVMPLWEPYTKGEPRDTQSGSDGSQFGYV